VNDQPTPDEATEQPDPAPGPSSEGADPTSVAATPADATPGAFAAPDPLATAPAPESPASPEPPTDPIPVEVPTGPTAPTAAATGAVTEPVGTLPPPPDPVGPPPWPAGGPSASGPASPPPPPPAGTTPSRPGAWKQFVVGALVGALVGGLTAGGIYVATKDDSASRTVIVRQPNNAARNTSAIAEPADVQGILSKVEPAVVAIRTGGAATGDQSEGGGAGTGFVISPDGVIVTNNHVVEGAGGHIEVAFTDGTSQSAKVLGRSPEYDVAVLKVDAKNLQFANLGSSEKLEVGDEVIAIGNALALEGGLSVTRGIISAKDRTVPEENGARLYSVLQTDAAINPGNSGGPLVNSDGEVVGINTAIADPGEAQNVGFAMSIDTVKPIIEDLRSGREVKTAFLGVVTQEVTPALAQEEHLATDSGALVRRLTSGSAADDAGLKTGDVITAVNDTPVGSPDELAAAIRKYKPGDKVQVRVERDGDEKTVTVTLGTRPASS
jgi:putative serine protease PepD